MSSRFTKTEPEFIYFIDAGRNGLYGPYVNPKKGHEDRMRKFKLTEVPMDPPKTKKKK